MIIIILQNFKLMIDKVEIRIVTGLEVCSVNGMVGSTPRLEVIRFTRRLSDNSEGLSSRSDD